MLRYQGIVGALRAPAQETREMSANRSSQKDSRTQPFDPSSTGSLNASETLKLLALPDTALPQTPEDLGLEALHRATFVQLPLGVGYATREGRFIWCNEAFELMLGLYSGEYREKTIAELTHKADVDSNDELLRDLWAGRIKSYSMEKRYVKRNGDELWVRVSAAMVRTTESSKTSRHARRWKWRSSACRRSCWKLRGMQAWPKWPPMCCTTWAMCSTVSTYRPVCWATS
jgi:PAS domain S-box-containing protein